MVELGKFTVQMHIDLFSDLLEKLSENGLCDLEGAIKGERYRRSEMNRLYPDVSKEKI
jgi:hypothetical protein